MINAWSALDVERLEDASRYMPVLSPVTALRWRGGTPRQTLLTLGRSPARLQLIRGSRHGMRQTRPPDLARIWLPLGVNASLGGHIQGENAVVPRGRGGGVVVVAEVGSGRCLAGSIDSAPDDLDVRGPSLAPPVRSAGARRKSALRTVGSGVSDTTSASVSAGQPRRGGGGGESEKNFSSSDRWCAGCTRGVRRRMRVGGAVGLAAWHWGRQQRRMARRRRRDGEGDILPR